MKEYQIPFSTDMVKAVLNGSKIQTRRTKGLKIVNIAPDEVEFLRMQEYPDCSFRAIFQHDLSDIPGSIKSPYGKKGDLLWVRESFKYFDEDKVDFKAQYTYPEYHKWKPSIHMPKAAARIWLQLEDVTVERLHDISEEDAIAEGVGAGFRMNAGWPDYMHIENGICTLTQDDAVASFKSLWEKINGKESLNANPFVWVVKFKVLSTTGRPNF